MKAVSQEFLSPRLDPVQKLAADNGWNFPRIDACGRQGDFTSCMHGIYSMLLMRLWDI